MSLTEGFPDLEVARAAYEAGDAAYAGVGGGGVRTSDYYGWAAIPPEFIQRAWGDAGLDVVEWVPSGTLFRQAMVGLLKRPTFPERAPEQRSSWFDEDSLAAAHQTARRPTRCSSGSIG